MKLRNQETRLSLTFITFALSASLTVACTEGDSERGSNAEAPTSEESDTPPPIDASTSGDIVWEPCGTGRCATLEVPVDYDDPQGETLPLRFFVGPAHIQQARSGVLFFNPGGPGVALVDIAEELHSAMARVFPTLDLVLMDNRGIGQSAPIDCVDDDFFERLELELEDDVEGDAGAAFDDEVLEVLKAFWSDFQHGCEERLGAELLSNLHTENVARDMERIREALGEPQLNLWAASYGTVQGSIYAKLYPERVRAFVLESPVFRGALDLVEDSRVSAASYDRELSRLLAWCAEDDRCGLGESVEQVEAGYDALQQQLDTGIEYAGIEGDDEDTGELDAATLFSAMQTWLLLGEWELIAEALSAAAAGNWAPLVAGAELNLLAEDDEANFAATQANVVIQALDYGCPPEYTLERARRDLEQLFEDYPRTALLGATGITMCLGWSTVASEPRVQPSDVTAPPLLLLTGANDPATPLAGAQALRDQLGDDSTLLVAELEGHGAVGLDEEVTLAFFEFIDEGKLTPSGSKCPVPCLERSHLAKSVRRFARPALPPPLRLPRQFTELGLRLLRPN